MTPAEVGGWQPGTTTGSATRPAACCAELALLHGTDRVDEESLGPAVQPVLKLSWQLQVSCPLACCAAHRLPAAGGETKVVHRIAVFESHGEITNVISQMDVMR